MNASRSASGSADVGQRDLAGGLGAADLAPDLVALLLVERREVAVEVGALREGDDRADVLALDVERPALADLARARTRPRGRRRPGRRSAGGGGRSTSHGAGWSASAGSVAARWSTSASATAGRSAGAARIVA